MNYFTPCILIFCLALRSLYVVNGVKCLTINIVHGPFYFVVKPQGFKTYTVLWLSLHVVKAVLGNNTSEFTLAYLLWFVLCNERLCVVVLVEAKVHNWQVVVECRSYLLTVNLHDTSNLLFGWQAGVHQAFYLFFPRTYLVIHNDA